MARIARWLDSSQDLKTLESPTPEFGEQIGGPECSGRASGGGNRRYQRIQVLAQAGAGDAAAGGGPLPGLRVSDRDELSVLAAGILHGGGAGELRETPARALQEVAGDRV